jgi:hypothetical protein
VPKINGVRIKERINELILQRDILSNQFVKFVKVFKSDRYPDLREVDARLAAIEAKIAVVQAFQAKYNTRVTVELDFLRGPDDNAPVVLDVLINVVGAYGRSVARWKESARGGPKKDRYSYQTDTKRLDEETAEYQLSPEDASIIMMTYQRRLNAIRAAIQMGNMTDMELMDDEYAMMFND